MDLPYAAQCPVFPAAVAVLLCLLVSLLSWWVLRHGGRWRRGGRGRRPPVAGTILHVLKNISRPYDYLTEHSRRYKTFRILAPSCSYVHTVDPANVEYILKTNFDNYGKEPYISEILKDLLGDGIFAVDGEKWRHQRKVASYEFSTKVLRDYSSVVFRKNATKLALVISHAATSQYAIDAQDLLTKSTMDSIFEVSMGEDLDTLSGSRTDAYAFVEAFDESSSIIMKRCFDAFWKIKRHLNIGSEATLRKDVKVIDDFIHKLIQRKKEQMAKQHNDLKKKEDILSRFIGEGNVEAVNGNEPISDKYLRDIILCFILAGKDSTANTLSWFFYMLCKHPAVQEKIAEEVKEATETPNDAPIGNLISNLNEHTLNKMQYLHATLSETLRLYPPLPVDGKVCRSDDTLPDGFTVKRGDTANYIPYSMGRMEALWGEDAEDFRPERWLNDDGVFCPESPFKFTAFQAGPRVCLGKEFAYRQMTIFAAVLLHRFVFELHDEQKEVKYMTMITPKIDGGLHVRAFHR